MRAAARLVRVLGLPVALVLAWWAVTAGEDNFYFPPPTTVATTFVDVWVSGRLLDDVLPSVGRLLAGLALALAAGVGLGLLIGLSPRVRAVFEPALEFLRAIPPPVLVPVMLLVAGVGDRMKILVILSGCLWPILLNTVEGARSVDEVLGDTCRCYGIQGAARIRHLVLRAASPQIMTGIRQALSIGIILMVISEMFAASSGLGFAILQFQRGFQIPEMWSGMVVLSLIGVTLSVIFRQVERRVLAWHQGPRKRERAEGVRDA
ncbi:MAG TPA: ABC transporter permease [Streptosporangiaceae bacterium]|nr:ABC transporter permease [Streptosporangiaceae bacterium]